MFKNSSFLTIMFTRDFIFIFYSYIYIIKKCSYSHNIIILLFKLLRENFDKDFLVDIFSAHYKIMRFVQCGKHPSCQEHQNIWSNYRWTTMKKTFAVLTRINIDDIINAKIVLIIFTLFHVVIILSVCSTNTY